MARAKSKRSKKPAAGAGRGASAPRKTRSRKPKADAAPSSPSPLADVDTPERIAHAVDKLMSGETYSDTRANLISHFGCARSTAEEYIKRARVVIAKAFEDEIPTLRTQLALTYMRNMSKAERASEFNAVAALGGRLSKLLGLDGPIKVERTGPETMTSAGQRARIAELLGRVQQRMAGNLVAPLPPTSPPVDPLDELGDDDEEAAAEAIAVAAVAN